MIGVARILPVDVDPIEPVGADLLEARMREPGPFRVARGNLREIVGIFPAPDGEHDFHTVPVRDVRESSAWFESISLDIPFSAENQCISDRVSPDDSAVGQGVEECIVDRGELVIRDPSGTHEIVSRSPLPRRIVADDLFSLTHRRERETEHHDHEEHTGHIVLLLLHFVFILAAEWLLLTSYPGTEPARQRETKEWSQP